MSNQPSEFDKTTYAVAGSGCLTSFLGSKPGCLIVIGLAVFIAIAICSVNKQERQEEFDGCATQYQRGDYQASLACFGKHISEHDESYLSLIWRGYSTLRLGQDELAREDFDTAWNEHPDRPNANLALGDFWNKIGNDDYATDYYNKAVGQAEKVAPFVAAHYSLAFMDQNKGDLQSAREHYNQGLHQYYIDGKWLFTQDYLNLGPQPYIHFMEISEALKKHAEIEEKLGNPNNAEYSLYLIERVGCLGTYYAKDYTDASSCFKRIINKNLDAGKSNRVFENMGYALYSMASVQQWDDVMEMANLALETAVPTEPLHDYSELLRWRAQAYKESGSYDDALKDVNESIVFKDDYYLTYLTRGTILQKQENHLKALDDFSQAISLADGSKTKIKEKLIETGRSYLHFNSDLILIFEGQSASYRVIGRIKEADDAQKKAKKCRNAIKDQRNPSHAHFKWTKQWDETVICGM